jgi:hypothetical protein
LRTHWLSIDRNSRDVARLDACSQKYAGLWLSTLPRSAGMALDDISFHIAVCLRLGINPFIYEVHSQRIRCKHHNSNMNSCRTTDLRNDPFHCLHCLFNNKTGRNTMHDRVLAHVVDLLKTCGGTHASALPKGFHGVDKDGKKIDRAQPDGIAYLHDGSWLFDVRGVDTTSTAYIEINKHDQNKAYEYANADKITKYQATANRANCKFAPFVFNVHGGLSSTAVDFVNKALRQKRFLPPGVSKQQLNFDKLTELVVSIMRSNADIILEAHKVAL